MASIRVGGVVLDEETCGAKIEAETPAKSLLSLPRVGGWDNNMEHISKAWASDRGLQEQP